MLTSPKQNTQTLAGLSAIPNKKGVHRANTATMTEGAGRRGGVLTAEISSYLAGSASELDFFGWRCWELGWGGGLEPWAHETLLWRSIFPHIYRNRCIDWVKLGEAMWGQHVGRMFSLRHSTLCTVRRGSSAAVLGPVLLELLQMIERPVCPLFIY